ncbi:MAG: hypothetical protein V4623_07835 [Pseudomonadota bacterium]
MQTEKAKTAKTAEKAEAEHLLSDEQIIDEAQKLLGDNPLVGEFLRLPSTITEQQEKQIYAVGHAFYSQGKYFEAAKAFNFLLRQNFTEAKYYKAFASCMFVLGQHKAALSAYTYGWALDCEDPVPLFYMGQCCAALKKNKEARYFLREFVKESKDFQQHAVLKSRAKNLLDLISRKSESAKVHIGAVKTN